MKAIGINSGHRISFMDHIVPLCQIMGIPVLCTDPWISELIKLFYPPMELVYDEAEEYCLDHILKNYDTLFYVDLYREPFRGFQFSEHIYRGNARSVCGLHGNSDKKRNLFWAEKYADEDVILLYGQHMVDFLQEKGIWDRIPHPVITGNFRFEFYLQHKEFFDQKIAPFLFPQKVRKTILYAPTWTSPNFKSDWRVDYSSFFHVYPLVLDQIPEEYQILVKLHPRLVTLFPSEVEEIKNQYADSDQILFLNEIPLIYPLLEKVDIYLGDYSSVGYDFLTFNRPMFFFNESSRDPAEDKGVHLYQCGRPILPADFQRLYDILKEGQEELKKSREETYNYAFGNKKPLPLLKKDIEEALA